MTQSDVADRRQWIQNVRENPRQAMEADLSVAVVGLVVAFMGGLISVAGVHPRWQSVNNNSPAPVLGALIVFAGHFVVAGGIITTAASVFVWFTGRHHSSSQPSAGGSAPPAIACPNGRRIPRGNHGETHHARQECGSGVVARPSPGDRSTDSAVASPHRRSEALPG